MLYVYVHFVSVYSDAKISINICLNKHTTLQGAFLWTRVISKCVRAHRSQESCREIRATTVKQQSAEQRGPPMFEHRPSHFFPFFPPLRTNGVIYQSERDSGRGISLHTSSHAPARSGNPSVHATCSQTCSRGHFASKCHWPLNRTDAEQ